MFWRENSVCVYGITGKYGSYHTKKMLEYGTNIVCGVSKNKDVKKFLGKPIFNSLSETDMKPDTAIFFVPAPYMYDAFVDAVQNGVKNFVVITEHIPLHDTLKMVEFVKNNKLTIIGPNCPGIIHPKEKVKLGIMPERYFKEGKICIISRSGTLMYEVAKNISEEDGVGIALGLGGDPVVGTNVSEAFEIVKKLGYEKVVLIGEIGGEEEVKGVEYALSIGFKAENIKIFFAGRHAPEGKRMGHAGAIIEGEKGTIKYKEKKLKEFGVVVVKFPWELRKITV